MSSEEKLQILKMVEEGKITPEEAMNLIEALNEHSVEGEADDDLTESSQKSTFDDYEGIASKVRSFSYIPLWIGVGITVLGGMLMFWSMQASGLGFWFYCAWLPFLLGVFVIALVAGSRNSRWLFVHIKQPPDSTERNISFGFPLPFGLGAWILRTFGRFIPVLDEALVSELLRILEENPAGEPQLVVDVHDEDDGEEVQIFIA